MKCHLIPLVVILHMFAVYGPFGEAAKCKCKKELTKVENKVSDLEISVKEEFEKLKNFIAGTSNTGCPKNWVLYQSSCYFLNTQKLSWTQALIECQHMGATLVSVQNVATNKVIEKMVTQHTWIGGYQPHGSSEPDYSWMWADKTTWNYENWAGGEPNNSPAEEDCVEIHTDGNWNDDSCTSLNPSVCQKSIGPVCP